MEPYMDKHHRRRELPSGLRDVRMPVHLVQGRELTDGGQRAVRRGHLATVHIFHARAAVLKDDEFRPVIAWRSYLSRTLQEQGTALLRTNPN